MLLAGRLLLPPGSAGFRAFSTCQQPPTVCRNVTPPGRISRQGRRGVLLNANKRATESGDPEPAPASRKGRKRKEEVAAAQAAEEAAREAAEAAVAAAEAAALAQWLDSGGNPEEDRRRFPYHRRLQTAASEGNIDGAESAFAGMEAAGLVPGPRAFHVLLCAFLKGGDTSGALGVAGRATEAGVQLLPESYAVLIFASMDATPPDVDIAKTLYRAIAGTGTEPQLPWSTLCRLLAGKGFAADTVTIVREGLRAGLMLDADVAEAYVKGLAETQQLDVALTFLESMGPKYGLKPEARHVTHLVGALAAAGSFDDASSLIDAAGNKGWGRNAGTFNALMAGYVAQLDDDDDEGTLAFSFNKMRGRMVQCGVRPNKFTFKLETEGHVKLKDPRSAMGAVKSLRTAAGTDGLRLLNAAGLSGLLQLLSDRDMPVDMLQLLVYMAEDGCRMPAGALVADGEGRTPLDAWLMGHLEGLSSRADIRSTEASMLSAPVEYVNDIPLGPGMCVVDEGGSIIPVSKCTVKELRAEAEARSILGFKEMKRPELSTAIKNARARLPFNVLQAQVKTAGQGVRGGSKKKAAAGASRKKARKGPEREIWVIDDAGDLEIREAPPDSAFRTEAEKFLLSESALEDIDLTDDTYALAANKSNKEIDFDALLEARMLDEGTAAVMNIGDEDVMSGFATLLPGAEADEEDGAAEDEEEAKGGELDEEAWRRMQSFEARSIDPQTLQEGYRQLQFLEAQQIDTDEANLVAGMDIAMDIVRAAETVGGGITPADLLLLTSGALAERNVNAAADVARRLSLLLNPAAAPQASISTSTPQVQQYDQAFVLQQYESLAEMCIAQQAVQQADVVLEAAEVAGLQPSTAILARLTAALRGQPRRSERLGRENAALLERAGVDDIGDLNLTAPQQQLPDTSTSTAQSAAADAASTEVTLEALSVQEVPFFQQQQQDDDEEEEEELPEDMQDMLNVLEGVVDWKDKQKKMTAALEKLGLDGDAITSILNQPAALMDDMSWLPAAMLAVGLDAREGEEEDEEEGEGMQGPKSINDMSFAELARACANDTLSPEQSEELAEAFEAASLPLLFDEVDKRILWPGSNEYAEWAASSPQEAAEDEGFLAAAMREEFAEELAQAEAAAAAVAAEAEQGITAEQLEADDPEMQQFLSLKQQYHEALQEMGLEPSSAQQEAAAAAGEQSSAPAPTADQQELLQQLHEQLQHLIDERQDDLRAAFKELGLPEPELRLDSDGDDESSSSSSSRPRQLTGR